MRVIELRYSNLNLMVSCQRFLSYSIKYCAETNEFVVFGFLSKTITNIRKHPHIDDDQFEYTKSILFLNTIYYHKL